MPNENAILCSEGERLWTDVHQIVSRTKSSGPTKLEEPMSRGKKERKENKKEKSTKDPERKIRDHETEAAEVFVELPDNYRLRKDSRKYND
ncbi:hypothetical protein Q1695_005176 [Nippostrongylus brasiliensis]|nr:hypothetical protein Q1695_005176 [Nippostrongylus brasiliensis]